MVLIMLDVYCQTHSHLRFFFNDEDIESTHGGLLIQFVGLKSLSI